MRIHTHTVCEHSQGFVHSSVGRSDLPYECSHTPTNSLELRVDKIPNHISRHHTMSRNLDECLKFVHEQKSYLSKTELLIQQVAELDGFPDSIDEKTAKSHLLRSALDGYSNHKYKNKELFGYGHETPIRIHLYLDRKRQSYRVPVVPLLGQPGFQALRMALGVNSDVGANICKDSQNEIFNLLLGASKTEDVLLDFRNMLLLAEPKSVHTNPSKDRVKFSSLFHFFKTRLTRAFENGRIRTIAEVPG